MKSTSFSLLLIATLCLLTHSGITQESSPNNDKSTMPKQGIGIKAGASYSYQAVVKSFSVSNNFGFFAGGYFAPPSNSRFAFRSELLLSRQSYDYANHQQTGNVMLTYILLPQLTTIKLTRFLELQAGGQLAILLNAKVDSSANPSSIPNLEKANNYFSRINYGVAAGLEFFPAKRWSIGTRYNLFFNMYKQNAGANYPAYVPDYSGNLKNGLVQLYSGFRF